MKFFRTSLFTLLAFSFLLTGFAAAKPMTMIEDVVINQNLDGNGVEGLNIRVNISNQGHQPLHDPSVILWVRENWQSNWRLIKKWSHHDQIDPAQKHAHDYFAYSQGYVDPALFSRRFEVKAEVWAHGKLRAKYVKKHRTDG